MSGSFASRRMAEGYARSRPPVHARVVDRIAVRLGDRRRRALDLGCGAGLSTFPLKTIADECIGIDPVVEMVACARRVAPSARFAVGTAEALPFAAASFDLITAAGSLNYADPGRAFPELARVLTSDGVLVAYDFAPGRTFRSGGALANWFDEFERRYPWPAGDALELDPETLGKLAAGFRLPAHQLFEIELPLSPGFYLEYVLTETNVSRAKDPPELIREWCRATLDAVFAGQTRGVLFRGYIAYLRLKSA